MNAIDTKGMAAVNAITNLNIVKCQNRNHLSHVHAPISLYSFHLHIMKEAEVEAV